VATSLTKFILSLAMITGFFSSAEPLKIAINVWPGYECIMLAKHLGFYKEENLDIRIIQFETLAHSQRAFERRQIDIMPSTIAELLAANDHGIVSGKIISVIDYSKGGDVILTRASIRKVSDLKNKTIAIEQGVTIGLYVLVRGLEQHGLNIGDLNLLAVPQNEMLEKVSNNKVDGVITYVPFSHHILATKTFDYHTLFSSKAIMKEAIDVMSATSVSLKNKSREIKKFLKAYWRAVEYLHQNPQKSAQLLAERLHVTPEKYVHFITDKVRILTESESNQMLMERTGLLEIAANYRRLLIKIKALSSTSQTTPNLIWNGHK
jgi:NitT/TauT family transport system substrate-binding protein